MKRVPPPPPAKTRKFRTKLEPWMAQVVSAAVERGMPLAACAGLIGVTKVTLHRWRQAGLEENCPDPMLVDMAFAIEEARSKAIERGVEVMQLHAAEDWRAQVELLRAQDPETWSPQQRSKVEVEVSAKPKSLAGLSDEELMQYELLENKMAAAQALPVQNRLLTSG